MTPIDKWIAVVIATINPLAGRAIAIPLGMGFGLPVVLVAIVSGVSNFALAAAMILLIDRFGHIQWIKNYIDKKRGQKITKFIQGKGLLYSVVVGPAVIGTFTVILVFQALGADKKRMVLYSLISTILITPLLAWIFPLFAEFFRYYKSLLYG